MNIFEQKFILAVKVLRNTLKSKIDNKQRKFISPYTVKNTNNINEITTAA